jgi:trehalose-6-phosphatase
MNAAVQDLESEIARVNGLIARARALIFDVDGTLAETEETHRQAFNEAGGPDTI